MLINLKNDAAKGEVQTVVVELHNRLPERILSPCCINSRFEVKCCDGYYLLTINVDAVLKLVCQRCLDEFSYHYVNQTVLAVCGSDDMAEKMMGEYESIVSDNNQVDLTELLTDELHLCAPEFHLFTEECNREAAQFITFE